MTKPVVKLFSAPWCGPCKMFKPLLKEVHGSNVDAFDFEMINIEEDEAAAKKYGIRGVPTVIVTVCDEVTGQKVGAAGKSQIEDFLTKSGVVL